MNCIRKPPTFRRLPVTLAIAALAASLAGPADAVTVTWTGAGVNSNWLTNANWAAGTHPFNGDSLVFQGSTQLVNQNNTITGLTLSGISFAANAGAFTLNGVDVLSNGDIGNASSQVQKFNLGVTVAANQSWDGGSQGMVFNSVTLGEDSSLYLVNRVTAASITPWTVASAGDATVWVGSGSTLRSGDLVMANGEGSIGTVTVNGAGSKWTVGGGAGDLVVGRDGVAQLNVLDGAAMTVGYAHIAVGSGSGAMHVGGAGASFASKLLEIGTTGYGGPGTLTIDGGALVNTAHPGAVVGDVGNWGGRVGVYAGGSGVASVSDVGSSWTTTLLEIGVDGTLAVASGGQVNSGSVWIGGSPAAAGNTGVGVLTVDGAGSLFSSSGVLTLGYLGGGSLNVTNGGRLTTLSSTLGLLPGSAGTASVSDAQSLWVNSGELNVGYSGVGKLRVDAGGVVTNGFAFIGRETQGAGMAGSVVVTGAGSRWDTSASAYINNGSLLIERGAVATMQDAIVGSYSGGSGSITVQGAGSQLVVAGTLHLADAGAQSLGGILTVLSGGSVSASALSIGEQGGLDLNGGQLQGGTVNLSGLVTVGVGSTLATATRLSNFGSLQLAGGTLSGPGILYNTAALTGYGRIDGTGGFTNSGLLTQSGGNLVLTNTGNNANLGTWVGLAGRQLDIEGSGLSNQGLIQLNGGSVVGNAVLINTPQGTVSGSGRIDSGFINQGSLVIDAGLTQITTSFLNQGQILLGANSATLSGGQIGNHALIQGYGKINSNISNVDVRGVIEAQGGTLTLSGLFVSPNGGTLAASNGAKLLITQGLASNAGQVQLAGGTLDNNGKVMLNASNGVISGYGTLRTGGLTQNGQIQLSGGSAVPSAVYGSVLANTGSKTILSGNSNATFYGTVDVQSGAELRVSTGSVATFFGLVQQRTGALFTGSGAKRFEGGLSVGASPGLGTDEGDVEFGESNVYLAEIGGTTACTLACGTDDLVKNSSYDKYIVGGQLSLGGTLKLVSWNGFVAQAGQQFDLLDWGSATGSFAAIDASGFTLAAGTALDVSQLYTTGTVSVSAVPEPGGWALLLAGLMGVGGIVKRRRCSI